MKSHLLSKTSFLRGLQCLKAVYLYKNYSRLKDPLPAERLARFKAGHETGFRARDLFPGGVDASPKFSGKFKESLKLTAHLIKQDTAVIYEAAFQFNDVLVLLDILVKTPEGWKAYEVKSSVNISQTYKDDAALQYYVINGSGLVLSDFSMVHLQKPLSETKLNEDPENNFQFTSLVDECRNQQSFIENKIEEIRNVLAYPKIPLIQMGEQCTNPYSCDFIGFCSKQQIELSEGLFGTL